MGRTVEGVIRKHRDGFGFLIAADKESEDVYLPAEELIGVVDGDRLRVELVRRRGRRAGRLLDIVERGRQRVVGVYRRRRQGEWVEPVDRALDAVQVVAGAHARPADGELVKVLITEWPSATRGARGVIEATLGAPGDPAAEVLSIAYSRGFSDVFPAAALAEAEKIPEQVPLSDLAGRRDLRTLPLVTIDGADARDFDDAIYCESLVGGGWRLVVAIADVAHYVTADSELDREAQRRGTSVYFPGMVLPMLPERLSNGICSLNPAVDRLCMVADLTLDAGGKVTNTELYDAVMRSHARLTYDEVAVMMGEVEGRVSNAHRFWQRDHLDAAVGLSRALQQRRAERGAIDLDLPEPVVVLDEDGLPHRIEPRERLWAHRLIEEMMLAANEAVAWFFGSHGLPTVYRVHEDPNPEKLEVFLELARAYGLTLKKNTEPTATAVQGLLARMEGRRERHALNFLLLRSMQQAVYDPKNVGHYGLAATHYLHFTSPIRRYPDLMVHRLLKEHWTRAGRAPDPRARKDLEVELERVSVASSERERAAMSAEREVDDFFGALYMRSRVGEEHAGTVTAATDFGLFVRLDEHFVEGLVRAETIGSSWELDERRHRLVFGKGFSVGLGDSVEVVCVAARPSERQVDFELVGSPTTRAKSRSTRPSKKPRARKRPPPRKRPSGKSRGRGGRRR